ncbi:glycoside hydrolase family 2 protein [Rhodococcus fascians]|nr:glycoside hydrolase family 2 protein [Rhodococcus fascians]
MIPFNDEWTFVSASGEARPVTLPHDAMLGEGRDPAAPAQGMSGYFKGGSYTYRKTWTPSESLRDKQVELVFEGIFRNSTISVDGTVVGGCRGGYREFSVDVTDHVEAGRSSVIEVLADNSMQPNSRWYTGSGIYRPVWLSVHDRALRFARDGIRTRVTSTGDPARLAVECLVDGTAETRGEVSVHIAVEDERGVVADRTIVVTGDRVTSEIDIVAPRLWSDVSPNLYRAVIQLLRDGDVVDEHRFSLGLRTVELVPGRGLVVNGVETTLRGANIHHDNGVIGATTLAAAEHRRVRILKDNGFNAIRSAHNAMSRSLLDACDELGMYVMDETYDAWRIAKTPHDDADRFDDQWRDEARAMIEKDRNRASVIMYSIGNEIPDITEASGVALAREMAEFARSTDSTRPVTLGVNFLVFALALIKMPMFGEGSIVSATASDDTVASSTTANIIANRVGKLINLCSRLPLMGRAVRPTFDALDVASYNYAHSRYGVDSRRHPSRMILGTESVPGDLPVIWEKVKKTPNVIGDFMWTGWDYLGEAGVGTWTYGRRGAPLMKSYPFVTGGCGAVDITGHAGAPAFLAKAVWDPQAPPRIAVRPLNYSDQKTARSAWRPSDAIDSWSWSGRDGQTAFVEVYSADDEVEILINSRSIGRKSAGRTSDFVARFETPYEAGEITAIGYRSGIETARSSLQTARRPELRIDSDRTHLAADGQDAAFLSILVADSAGNVESLDDDEVDLAVTGAATLVGFGNGAPHTTESYADATHTTFFGRALAVIRSTGESGTVTVTATSRRHGIAVVTLTSE